MREIIIALNTITCDMSVNIAIRTNSYHADESEADRVAVAAAVPMQPR